MRLVLMLALAMSGCNAADSLDALVGEGSPTPPGFELEADNAVAGASMALRVRGAPAGAVVRIAYSGAGLGAGPCPAAIAPGCLSILGPAQLAPLQIRVGANGEGTAQVPLPAARAGTWLALQAVVVNGALLSNPVERRVGAVGAAVAPGVDGDGDTFTPDRGDCADHDASIHPGAPDAAGDGHDQDCDNADGADRDGDGFPAGVDCDDADRRVHPGAFEDCNGADDDCDGQPEPSVPIPPGAIMFAAAVPTAGFTHSTSTFGNHLPSMEAAPRGGDLMLRYANGTLRNLTREAGYGEAGVSQGALGIAVREPSVHWSGNKALFAMAIGAPEAQYRWETYTWQLYEASCLAPGQTVRIRKVEGQPEGFNNVSPIYGTDDQVIFTSDRPRSGHAAHYPPLDEYESSPTVTGLYALDEGMGSLELLEHAPSGVFSPSIDSRGMIVFTKWDHLQRDQQGDGAAVAAAYLPLTWADEMVAGSGSAVWQGSEVFPEARTSADPTFDPALSGHTFNQFMPWEVRQDGTAEETLVHVGRQELGGTYTDGSFVADTNLTYFVDPALHANRLTLGGDGGLLHIAQDPLNVTRYYGTRAPEFTTAAGGEIIRVVVPSGNADQLVMDVVASNGTYRDPLPMSDGRLLAVWTATTGPASNIGTTAAPVWNYSYRVVPVVGGVAGAPLTSGITRSAAWWNPDVRVTWSGVMWELDPVEVTPRLRPSAPSDDLPAVEQGVFDTAGVDVEELRDWMRARQLALIVSRDVTQRDRADWQQPYNLRVPGGVSSIVVPPVGPVGTVYDVTSLQIFQADAVRGYDGRPGRRQLARAMHEPGVTEHAGAPAGGVTIAPDGSIAAFVPAGRALTWQLTDPAGEGIVRERNWLSFAPGEVRVCASCHGINTLSQTGDGPPTNPPEALAELLADWLATR